MHVRHHNWGKMYHWGYLKSVDVALGEEKAAMKKTTGSSVCQPGRIPDFIYLFWGSVWTVQQSRTSKSDLSSNPCSAT